MYNYKLYIRGFDEFDEPYLDCMSFQEETDYDAVLFAMNYSNEIKENIEVTSWSLFTTDSDNLLDCILYFNECGNIKNIKHVGW